MPDQRHSVSIIALLLMLAGCSRSESTSPSTPAPSVARVAFGAPIDTVAVGQTRQLSVSLFGSAGQLINGRAITWSSSSRDVATISSDGVAHAVAPGRTNILAQSGGATASLTLVVPQLVPQTAPPQSASAGVSVFPRTLDVTPGAAAALMIRVLDADGAALSGPVFSVQSSNSSVITVGPAGDFRAIAPGSATIMVTAGGMSAAVPVTVQSLAPSGFHFDLRFVGPIDQRVVDAANQAAARWERVLPTALPTQNVNLRAGACEAAAPAINTITSGIVVTIAVDSIDGGYRTIGLGGPCAMRSGAFFPAVGAIQIDRADVDMLAANGSLANVLAHELGHVLGIGTLWAGSRTLLADTATSDPRFTGANAIQAATALGFDTRDSMRGIAVENAGASASMLTHWRESVYMSELMTSVDGPGTTTPLSLITVESLRDLGYQVRDAGADFFTAEIARVGGLGLSAGTSGNVLPPMRAKNTERVQAPRFTLTQDGRAIPIVR